jgi:hypothetical protein
MKLEEAVVGRKVIYTPFKGCDRRMLEDGIITRIGDTFVFVRYGKDEYSKATCAPNIEYLPEVEATEDGEV